MKNEQEGSKFKVQSSKFLTFPPLLLSSFLHFRRSLFPYSPISLFPPLLQTGRSLFTVVIAVLTLHFTLYTLHCLYAGGFESPGLGARAVSMGGAFVGVADDWSAIYWNPAGLAQMEGKGAGASLSCGFAKAKDGNSMKNYDGTRNVDQGELFQRIYPSEPDQFNKKTIISTSYCPGFGIYDKLGKFNITVAGGMYVPVANITEWDDNVNGPAVGDDISASYKNKFYIVVGNLSAAKAVTEKLLVGCGINLLYQKTELSASKIYGTDGTTGSPLYYSFNYDQNASGVGFEGVVGLFYKVTKQIKAGGVYRSGSKISLNGDASATNTLLTMVESSGYTQDFYHPATFGLGASYKPIDKLLVAGTWQRTDWRKMKDKIEFNQPGAVVLKNTDRLLDWSLADWYRLGGEYLFNDKITLSGGITMDMSPVPDKGVSLAIITDTNKMVYNVGVGYKLTGNTNLDFGYGYVYGTRTADGVDYAQRFNVVRFEINSKL